jgi:hypothetical protein
MQEGLANRIVHEILKDMFRDVVRCSEGCQR